VINEKVRLYAKVGKSLIEAKELEQDPFESLQSIISWEQFVQSVEQAEELARPAEFDYLELLDNYYGHFRKFAPRLLRTYVFKASKNLSRISLVKSPQPTISNFSYYFQVFAHISSTVCGSFLTKQKFVP